MHQRHAVIAPAPSSYPDVEQLQTVYGTYLKPVLHLTLASHPVWGSTAKVHALAGSMVQVYEQVSVLELPTRSCNRMPELAAMHVFVATVLSYLARYSYGVAVELCMMLSIRVHV